MLSKRKVIFRPAVSESDALINMTDMTEENRSVKKLISNKETRFNLVQSNVIKRT